MTVIMIKSSRQQSAEQRWVQQLWGRQKHRDDVVLHERPGQHQAEMAKMVRLKSPHLVKESADKEAKKTAPSSRRKGAKVA